MKRTAILFFSIMFGLLLHSKIAHAQKIYKWIDEKGTTHSSDNLNAVPEKYKDKTQKKVILILGIILMILLVSQPAGADNIAYTRRGWIACPYLTDLSDAIEIFYAKDYKALAEMVAEGRCIIFSDEVKVYYSHPDWANWERQIRFPGSSKTYWVHYMALIYPGEEPKELKGSPTSKRKWVILESFLWIKPNKTTRQEIIKKYPNPKFRDESGGEYAYYGYQYPDFKEWDKIRFIFDGSALAEIRAVKEQE